ncbi:hypothetical protein ACVKXF_001515 [Curtobacterium sp. PvP017]
MCPARNAHWYHPVTEQIEPGAICLHRCNASTRRVMHHSCASNRRAAHESCAVQRAARARPARLRLASAPASGSPQPASGSPQPRLRLARGSEISACRRSFGPASEPRRSARGVLWNLGTPTGRPGPSPLASADRSRPARPRALPAIPPRRAPARPGSRFRNLGISTLVRPGIGTSAERTRRVVEPRHADREARHTSTATVTSPTWSRRTASVTLCGRVTAALVLAEVPRRATRVRPDVQILEPGRTAHDWAPGHPDTRAPRRSAGSSSLGPAAGRLGG